jgi:hypothetical protein
VTATIFYDDVNEVALLTNTFLNSSGTAADPTTVSCVVTEPSGVAVTHTYNGVAPADIVKPLVGKYTLSVPCSPSVTGVDGLWSFVWIGTGAVSDVQPGTWRVLPETIGRFYCGLEELKDRLGVTDNLDDSSAQMAIQAASSWINEYTGNHFYRITETRTFRPQNIWKLDIDPVVSVTAFNVDTTGNGTFDQPWTQNTDYQLLLGEFAYNQNAYGLTARPFRQVQVLQAGKWFPFTWPYSHLDRIQISGTWGWPAVPPPVSQACLVLAAQFFKEKDAPFGVAGVSDFGVIKVQANPWIVELLRPYIFTRRKVGV